MKALKRICPLLRLGLHGDAELLALRVDGPKPKVLPEHTCQATN